MADVYQNNPPAKYKTTSSNHLQFPTKHILIKRQNYATKCVGNSPNCSITRVLPFIPRTFYTLLYIYPLPLPFTPNFYPNHTVE